MGPSSAFLLALIGVTFILIDAIPVDLHRAARFLLLSGPSSAPGPSLLSSAPTASSNQESETAEGPGDITGQRSGSDSRECPPGQEYNECGSACYSPCRERDPDVECTLECIPGCYCKPGFIFSGTKCVPCNPTHTDPDSECPPDQVYKKCESACYSPCGKRHPDQECTQQCITGCFCKPGFTFLEGSKKTKCVPCNPTYTDSRECPPGQEYNECGSACYSPCRERDPDVECTLECIPGCYCKPGFIFSGTKCVPCNPTHTDHECPPDQVYKKCESACYSPCGKSPPDQECTQQCITGCFCKPGFTFLEGSKKTKCVPCNPTHTVVPPDCPENQEFNPCGSACPANCTNPDPSPVCNKKCVQRCFCKKGYLEDGNGGCVKEEECRACTGNRTYGCGSLCPDTCSNRNEKPRICRTICVFGCNCKPGYVLLSKDDKTRCVLPKDCPP